MASKFQKTPFPGENLAKMQSVKVITPKGESVSISYQDLSLIYLNGQICFFYHSEEEGDLIMPIARKTTLISLSDSYQKEKKNDHI